MPTLMRAIRRLFNPRDPPAPPAHIALVSVFGPLEFALLEALWRRSAPLSVKDLQRDFPDVAYTTLMTTLDRLYKKAALVRSKHGRAFYYEAHLSRNELESRLASRVFATLLAAESGTSAVLSSFIEAVGERDASMLDELEELLRQRRAEAERQHRP